MEKEIPTLVVTCGLPASGKSTWSKEQIGFNVHSSDEVRKTLNYTDGMNDLIFKVLFDNIKADLLKGNSCILDATNMSNKKRRHFLRTIKRIRCFKKCIIFVTPVDDCKMRNELREGLDKVPNYVIDKFYRGFQVPSYFEGWDEIEIKYSGDFRRYQNITSYIDKLDAFDQENEHHSFSLGVHSTKTKRYIQDNISHENNHYYMIRQAALMHDIGKVQTKTFKNAKGDQTSQAHYYGHENVGAYESLLWNRNLYSKDALYIALLINLHMKPFDIEGQKSINKFIDLYGQTVWDEIMDIHIADTKNQH